MIQICSNCKKILLILMSVQCSPYKIHCIFFCFIWVFLHQHFLFTGQQGKGEAISLTPLYHFPPLHRLLDISQAITAEFTSAHSWQPDLNQKPLLSKDMSLNTMIHALMLRKACIKCVSCAFDTFSITFPLQ